jgi:hypothetical protein
MTWWRRLFGHPVSKLIAAACVLALVGLAILAISVLFPGPLPVILGMSLGHAVGIGAFGLYVLAVVVDAASRRTRGSSAPPPR